MLRKVDFYFGTDTNYRNCWHRHEPLCNKTVDQTYNTSRLKRRRKVAPELHHHPRSRYGRVKVTLHSIFNLGTSWNWMVSLILRPLYPRGTILDVYCAEVWRRRLCVKEKQIESLKRSQNWGISIVGPQPNKKFIAAFCGCEIDLNCKRRERVTSVPLMVYTQVSVTVVSHVFTYRRIWRERASFWSAWGCYIRSEQ